MVHTMKATNSSVSSDRLNTMKNLIEKDLTHAGGEQLLVENLSKIHHAELHEIKIEIQMIRKELERLKPSVPDELLTMKEVCKLLKLSRPSVHTLIHKKKKLRPVQLLDQDFRFLRKDVEAMISESYKDLPGGLNAE